MCTSTFLAKYGLLLSSPFLTLVNNQHVPVAGFLSKFFEIHQNSISVIRFNEGFAYLLLDIN